MTDNLTPEKRTLNMRRIRSSNTKPEERVRKYLFSRGIRYRKNHKGLPGTPDIVIAKYKTVIFVQGCFWHMHDCGRFRWPTSNREYWESKIRRNVARDHENLLKLQSLGWKVLIVWECEIRKDFQSAMDDLIESLTGSDKE